MVPIGHVAKIYFAGTATSFETAICHFAVEMNMCIFLQDMKYICCTVSAWCRLTSRTNSSINNIHSTVVNFSENSILSIDVVLCITVHNSYNIYNI